MVRGFRNEQSEITMDYANMPGPSAGGLASRIHSGEDSAGTPAVSGRRKLYRLVGVSFGLLCILQAVLNISLRLALYSSHNKTSGNDASCKNLTKEPHDLKGNPINFDQHFQQGWVYFHHSLYYISSVKKSWQDSRDDCLKRGADLVIINSKQEQDFTRKIHNIRWIGLMGRGPNGKWRWVDGTPLTKSYWGPGEPNGYEGKNEDCVEIRFHDKENSWNDIPCGDENFWICEKTVAL